RRIRSGWRSSAGEGAGTAFGRRRCSRESRASRRESAPGAHLEPAGPRRNQAARSLTGSSRLLAYALEAEVDLVFRAWLLFRGGCGLGALSLLARVVDGGRCSRPLRRALAVCFDLAEHVVQWDGVERVRPMLAALTRAGFGCARFRIRLCGDRRSDGRAWLDRYDGVVADELPHQQQAGDEADSDEPDAQRPA